MNNNDGSRSQKGRRDLLKIGAAATASTALPAQLGFTSVVAKDLPPGPTTPPFLVPLPMPSIKVAESALFPAPTTLANLANGEAGREAHQGLAHWPVKKYYNLRVKEGMHSYHPYVPTQKIWGYDGTVPGPTFIAYHGEPAMVRIHNELPQSTIGHGSPEISTHLHNAHCGSESDGFAGNYYSKWKKGPTLGAAGGYKDHHYPNCYANYDRYDATDGDPREGMGTLWYHDHRMDFTAGNVYRGLAGFYLMFDHIDTGNERDTRDTALRLPSGVGVHDIPLALTDMLFDSSGNIMYDQFENKGHMGNRFCVNGKIQPFFKVQPRKYRFRFLDASLARYYELYIVRGTENLEYDHIANDGNLLPAPLKTKKVQLAPAERGDIVFDFAPYAGWKLYLVNRLIMKDGRGPDDTTVNVRDASGNLVHPGVQLMRFDVAFSSTPVEDPSRVPPVLRALAPINLTEVTKTRKFRFDKVNDVWTVNGKIFDPEVATAKVKRGATEIWELEGNGSWHHPVHIHMTEGRILSRNGKAPPPHERARKDVYSVAPGEVVRVLLQFSDFTGKYMMHCHNLTHEDHSMMIRFDVEA